MPLYRIPAQSGVYTVKIPEPKVSGHIIAFAHDKPGAAITSGVALVEVRAPGSTKFEAVPDGSIQLTDPATVLFTFSVAEYRVTITNYVGPAGHLYLTDSFAEV